MKVTIYFDVEPWMRDAEYIWPTTKPNAKKSPTATRYRIEVEIFDPAEPDVILEGKAEIIDK